MSHGLRWTEEELAELKRRKVDPYEVNVLRKGRPLDTAPAPSRERNVRVKFDGLSFDSKREAGRYKSLLALVMEGRITELQHHPVYPLVVEGWHICDYEPDFAYRSKRELIVEDVKGRKSGGPFELFKLKAKLMKALYGIDVVVV